MSQRLPILAEDADFVRRMGEGWAEQRREPQVAAGLAPSVAVHREQLSGQFAGVALLVFAGGSMVRNDDNNFAFRADSDFLWLTGCSAEGAVLAMVPRAGGHDSVLYIPQPITAGSPGFLDSRNHSELWVGASPALEAWSDALGIAVRPLHSAPAELADALRGLPTLAAGRPTGPLVDNAPFSPELAQTISELRLIKDAWEVTQ